MQKRKILVTAALPYANGDLHLGHLLGPLQADIWCRYQKLRGNECSYVCGDDAHGTPIMLKAKAENITPEQLIAKFLSSHQKDFADFGIAFDNYYTTHSEENKTLAAEIYLRLKQKDYINTRIIQQAYDLEAKMFLPDRFIKGTCPNCKAPDQYGDSCEVCGSTYSSQDLINPVSAISGSTPVAKESVHYFFNLPKLAEQLKTWITTEHLQAEVAHKIQEWFNEGLQEWDISRDEPYFGFEIPEAPGKYFYVWLDAPIGYMASFLNLCSKRTDLNFNDYWEQGSKTELIHFIGKDIIYFHVLFWPALLSVADFRLPNKVCAHGFLTINGQKMSKSRGTFLLARKYLDHLPAEPLRYYFASKLSERIEDVDLNLADFKQRVNSDLVGKFVNLASRCAKFIETYFAGKLAAKLDRLAIYQHFAASKKNIADCYENFHYSQLLRQIMNLADEANRYIDEEKPWSLIKQAGNELKVQEVCTTGLNLFKIIAIYLKPVLPNLAQEVEKFLQTELTWDELDTPILAQQILPFNPLLTRITDAQIASLNIGADPA